MKSLLMASGFVWALLASSPVALAQETPAMQQAIAFSQDIPWGDIAASGLDRARRSIAFGPSVSAVGQSRDGFDGTISFGVGLYRFNVPIAPDRTEISAILRERFTTLFLERLKEAKGGATGLSAKQVAKQVWDDILKSYVKGRKPRLLEEPGVRILAEGTRFLGGDTWHSRLIVGIGGGPFSLGLAVGGEFGEENRAFVGVELAKPLVFGGARSPVLDLLVRADRRFGNGPERLSFSFGARFLLDVI